MRTIPNFTQRPKAVRVLLTSILVAWMLPAASGQSWDGRSWHIARHSDDRDQVIIQWVLAGQTTRNWTELVVLQLFGSRELPDEVLASLRGAIERKCPQVVWEVLRRDLQSILYEWRVRDCSSHPDQHEITKLVQSDEGVYRFSYSARTAPQSPNSRTRWIERLAAFQPSALKRLRREAAHVVSAGALDKLDTERNSPGIVFDLEEVSRRREGGATAVRYRFKATGLPPNKEYIVWNVPAGRRKPVAMLRAEVDAKGQVIYDFEGERGKLSRLLVKIHGYMKAQPAKFALVSTDGSVHSFVRKIPFPVTHQDRACRLSVEMQTRRTYHVLLSGFTAGETVEVSADLGKETFREHFTAQTSTRHDTLQRKIPLRFQRKSGHGMVKAVARSCTVSATYDWGTKAKVQ